MGSYSVICAVSGTPLEFFNQVIGIELEPYRFPGDRYAYVPASWPVYGEYDTCGGIEGELLSPNCALFHREVWDSAELYWHVENRKYGRGFLDFEFILSQAQERDESEKKLRAMGFRPEAYEWTLADQVWYVLESQLTKTDEGLTLREMLNSKKHNVTGVPEDLCFLERSTFGELLVQKILAGWTAVDAEVLYRLVCLWCGQSLTGRQIIPSVHISIEQCPTYRQRIKIAKLHAQLLKGNVAQWKSLNKDRKV